MRASHIAGPAGGIPRKRPLSASIYRGFMRRGPGTTAALQRPCRRFSREFNLPQSDGHVLGTDLNRSESSWRRAGRCPSRVKMRRTHIEHMLSALRPLATEERTFQIGSFVPRADIRQTHPIRRRRANGFSGSGADRSGVLTLIAATETLLAIHLRPVELGSVPKAIKFIFHAPPDVPSA